jgi:hypothetical protein
VTEFTSSTVMAELIRRGVSINEFSIEGVHRGLNDEGTLVLNQDGDEWVISARDRGRTVEIARYPSEGVAADAFLARLTPRTRPLPRAT